MIQDFCIINRFDVVSTVCDGCIGCTQFNICDTAGDAAKRSGKVCIAPYITIGIFVSLCSMSNASVAAGVLGYEIVRQRLQKK